MQREPLVVRVRQVRQGLLIGIGGEVVGFACGSQYWLLTCVLLVSGADHIHIAWVEFHEIADAVGFLCSDEGAA